MGLIAGPLLLYAAGLLVLKIRGEKQIKQIQQMKEEHNNYIKSLRKEYEGYRKQFNKLTIKMQKVIDRAPKPNEVE